MIIEYVSKAVQDEAQLAGKRNRLVLEARRARVARRKPGVSAAPTRRLARLLLRRAPSAPGHFVILGAAARTQRFVVPTVGSTEASSRQMLLVVALVSILVK